ncbi:MAG: hypothetical protein ACXVA9_06490 [Bdellovibrionales bacterium]
MRRLLLPLQICLLVLLAYAYLYPGSEALLDQRTDTVMSDDTDPATLPYQYGNLIKTWQEHPSRFFYGTVYYDGHDPEFGIGYWVSWSERWIVLATSYFFPVEQLSTAFIFILMILNALCMYGLARYLNWNRSIASGLAIAWAFCAYTRARAKVHGGLVGTYHLPLLFLGLFLVVRGKGKRSLIAAAACFLIAVTAAHYYIVNSLFLAPFFLLFVAMQPEARRNLKRMALRLTSAILPALLFLAFNFLNTIPSGTRMSVAQSFPQGGEIQTGVTHPFLFYFAAHPIDYLGGDISLNATTEDPSPLKQAINEKIYDSIRENPGSNAHERTNGIRWSIIILSLAAIIYLALGRFRGDPTTNNNLWFFALFALFTFWLSLSPDVPFTGMGPSLWLQSIFHQMRVPSRAGINVHFALLMITGFFLSSQIKWRKLLQYPGVFPLIMIAGYPPLAQNMPMASIRPAFTELQRENGACGAGLYFPYASFYQASNLEYVLLQRMRGSDCSILNALMAKPRVAFLTSKFPPSMDYLRQLPQDQMTPALLEKFARCVPLTWIIFDPAVPQDWREGICRRLGWQMNPSLSCISPNKGAPLQRFPDDCQ